MFCYTAIHLILSKLNVFWTRSLLKLRTSEPWGNLSRLSVVLLRKLFCQVFVLAFHCDPLPLCKQSRPSTRQSSSPRSTCTLQFTKSSKLHLLYRFGTFSIQGEWQELKNTTKGSINLDKVHSFLHLPNALCRLCSSTSRRVRSFTCSLSDCKSIYGNTTIKNLTFWNSCQQEQTI